MSKVSHHDPNRYHVLPISGFSCSFATDTGDRLSCYDKQGVPVSEWIISGLLGLAVPYAIVAIFVKCCRQRVRDNKKRKALSEETDFQSRHLLMKSIDGGD